MAARRPIEAGRPYPMGATWTGAGVNFALFSCHATKVELCLFDPAGRRELERIPLPEYTDEVWHGFLPDGRPGMLYGYRVHGPYDPPSGHRFNANKLLIDPYARALAGPLRWHDAMFGYRVGNPRQDLSFDRRDSAPSMPKCQVVEPAHTWRQGGRPERPWPETVIYEAHLRGYTINHPEVPAGLRGTCAGLAHPAVLDYLTTLGVTAIELLPVHAFINDRYLIDRGLSNYWGYNTLAFCAPEPRYLASGDIAEFRAMVAALHSAGIEVILDVVYNHTAEGNHLGPTLSFRGIDNASYYRLMPDDPRYYNDATGTGNTVNLSHPKVLQLVMDSLRYWVEDMHVDGFRFDLASALAREANGFDVGSGFFDAIRQDPALAGVKLIGEPWDVGMGGYQVGGFPPGWSEWNDRYRDTTREFWRGDGGKLGALAARISGSADLFRHHGRHTWASLNFVTAHDGFTLHDVVSYNASHNEANGEISGHGDNKSWNCGVEGPTADPEISRLRERQKRNLLATLLLSQGVPMLLAGDEFGRTQGGNNNAYCQDNAVSWINWDERTTDDLALADFTRAVIELRRDHAVFRCAGWLTGQPDAATGNKDIVWLSPEGREMTLSDWRLPFGRCIGLELHGRERDDETFLVIINAHFEFLDYILPPSALSGAKWRRVLDTALSRDETLIAGATTIRMVARSLSVFRRTLCE